jgi:uncharacterized protein YfaS (alpha-2-macroglobulin family)
MGDPRNVAIAVLGAAVLVLAVVLWSDRAGPPGRPDASTPDRPTVSVLDVVLDRDSMNRLDLVFDRRLGEGRIGDVLDPAPAKIEPETGGVWRWRGANVLRFEPSGRFVPATRYAIELDSERVAGDRYVFFGETQFSFVTDRFQVDRVAVREGLAPEAGAGVVLSGTLFFNYPVEVEELAPQIRLEDPVRGETVPVEIESRGARRAVQWRSAAVEKLDSARELQLRVAGALTPATGNLPLGTEFVHPIPIGSRDRLEVRGVEARPGEEESSLSVELSSPVASEQARRHLAVDPPVEFSLRVQRNVLELRGPFRPGERYRLRLSAGLVAEDGARLGDDFEKVVALADLPPSLAFTGRGIFLSASGPRSIELETTNVSKVELVVERVYRNNVLYLLEQRGYSVWREQAGYGGLGRIYGDAIARRTLDVGGARNRSVRTALRIDEYVADETPGLYRFVAGSPGRRGDRLQQWVLVTDLGIVAKRSAEDVLVWVVSLRDLAPVAGARVTLLSHQNQVVAEGRTGARGWLRLSGLPETPAGGRPALVTVQTASDWSFLPFAQTRVETAGLDVGGASVRGSGYDAFLYGERDIYRPGETARGVALVRDRDLGTPPGMPAVLRHRDPEGQLRGTVRLDLERGGADFEHEIASYERTGRHSLELLVGDDVVGTWRFHVEEFVPDRIRVEIATPRPEVGVGEALEFDVSSAYLFGPPAAGLAVDARVRLAAQPFRPRGFEGFAFGNPERRFQAQEIFERKATLDETGRIHLAVPVPSGLAAPAALEAFVTARVQEQGGRGVTASERLRVHPVPHYLGLRREQEGYVEPGQPVVVEFAAVRPDGAAASAGALRAELYADRWQTVLRRTPSGSYRYESKREPELLATRDLEAGLSRGRVEFTPPDFGSYRVVLSDAEAGASSALRFYASGFGYAPWAVESPGRVELDVEREELVAGERAVVQVRSPFPGTLLLAVERERVLHWEVHRLDGNTAKLSLPVRESWRPNVYVTALVLRSVRDLEPGTAARAFGAVPLFVDRAPNRLDVALSAPEQVRPETTLEIELRTEPGARVTVAAVDEGILQLVAQQTPDPFGYFYRKRALSVGSHDVFALLLPDVEGEAPAGGGLARGAREQFVRTEGIRRVRPVAFWTGLLDADGAGWARARFDLPGFQGALRVMAVANAGRRFGSSEQIVRVRSPLVLLPTFPRFLSFGERVGIPVTVRNDTGRDGRFSVALRAAGPAGVVGDATRTVEVANGREQTITFTLETRDRPGEVQIALEASGNGETAAASVELGVRPDLPAVTLERAGSVGVARLELSAEEISRLRPEGLAVSLRLSSLPLVQLSGKLDTLLRYPYGCLEQTVSQVFPLLHLGPLARELEPDLFEEQDPDALVAAGIARVASMRLASGGFSLWPRGRSVHAWGSIQATHFLVEAERAGHGLPTGLLDGSLAFVAGEARPKKRYSQGALERAVYALYVLARAGRADVATMDYVREKQFASLRPASRAQLAAAYGAAGDATPVAELTRGLDDAERIRRQTGGNFASTTRNRALLLLALLDAAPDDPRIEGLAERLARDALTQQSWSTQETGFALLALGELFQRQSAKAPYAGEVHVRGEPVARFTDETVVLRDLPAGPVEIRMDPGYEPGSAFYSLRVRGVPRDEAFEPVSAGLELERSITRRDGGAVETVEQGELLRLELRVKSTSGRLENVVIQNLLPSGLEIENPRLATSETLRPEAANLEAAHLDIRDDRLLVFADLPDVRQRVYRALLRAVVPGRFRLPPAQAEAMYDGTIRATGERGTLEVVVPGAAAAP